MINDQARKVSLLLLIIFTINVQPVWSDKSKCKSEHLEDTVAPVPYEAERKDLLIQTKNAKKARVGIGSFVSDFEQIERLVRNETSSELVRIQIDTPKKCLAKEFSSRDTPLVPFQENSIGLLSISQARDYVLLLINAERTKNHLKPLKIDSTANLAAQKHCNEMATLGYFSHWNVSGKKPWERYNEVGGVHNVGENLALMGVLPKGELFSTKNIYTLHNDFMNELPPEDGHKQQILRPEHTNVGIGLSYSKNKSGRSFLYLVQEFIDIYGEYQPVDKIINRGKPFEIRGKFFPGVKFEQISIDWEPKPRKIAPSLLKNTGSYSEGIDLVSTISLESDPEYVDLSMNKRQQIFSVKVQPDNHWKPGLYYIKIYAKLPHLNEPTLVSTRTFYLE